MQNALRHYSVYGIILSVYFFVLGFGQGEFAFYLLFPSYLFAVGYFALGWKRFESIAERRVIGLWAAVIAAAGFFSRIQLQEWDHVNRLTSFVLQKPGYIILSLILPLLTIFVLAEILKRR